ncbi:MAG: tetratricopeptide repeat protein [Phycisphaeraceae bacterium]
MILAIPAMADPTFDDLDLAIAVDRVEAVQHVPRIVTVTLRNPTQHGVEGNVKLRDEGWLHLYLTPPGGQEQEVHTGRSDAMLGIEPGPVPTDIAPGATFSHRVLLRGGDQIVESGEYRIRAEFEDWDRSSTIEAEPIVFEVTPLPEDEQEAVAFLAEHDLLEELTFQAGAINPSRVEGMEQFVAQDDFQDSMFMPYIKARLGSWLMQRHGTEPQPSEERIERGIQLMTQAIETPDYEEAPAAMFHLATSREYRHQPEQARPLLRKLVDEWPESHLAPRAREHLKVLDRREEDRT